LNKLPTTLLKPEQRAVVVQGCTRLSRLAGGLDKEQEEAFAAARAGLATGAAFDALPATELAFWKQFFESATAFAEAAALMTTKQETGEKSYGNIRDPQMARNFLWLAQELYPKKKIIVWAAAFHLLRNQADIAMVTEPGKTLAERKTVLPYVKIATMGNDLNLLRAETYSIFFTAAEGEFATIRMDKPQKLQPLIPGSLEDFLVKAGCENAFLDLRQAEGEGSWLKKRLVARVLGHADYEADWTQVCDGLVFTRKMYPSTLIQRPTADARRSDEKYQPRRDPASLGVPFDRYTTRDAFGRVITFYLSHPPSNATEKLPVAVFIQGSGCASVFSRRDGKVSGGLQNLLLAAGKGRLRVLVVEKPGVQFGDVPKQPGSSEEGSADFRREHVLPRWVEAVHAALLAGQQLPDVDWSRTLVVGHSEGGIVAAHLAAAEPRVTHVAVLAGGGPTQLFDLATLAAQPRQPDEPPEAAARRVQQVYAGWDQVSADPDSADKLWMGHPYRRWSSFLKTSPLEGLLASRAAVFLAQGTADRAVSVASFDVLRAELTARGRDVTAERLEGCDHGFRKPDDPPTSYEGFNGVCGRAIDWFLTKSAATQQDVKKDLERLQGTWDVVAYTQDGENRPLEGPLANLRLIIDGDQRTVALGERVTARSLLRINPATSPKSLDLTGTLGTLCDQTLLGIYEIDGDQQRFCLALPGEKRPTEFASAPNSGHTLMVLRRAPPK
jgi:uncharacterized protein (TIGR03067 family)